MVGGALASGSQGPFYFGVGGGGQSFLLTYTTTPYIYISMKRTNIYLSEKQLEDLNKLAREEGLSMAELVRRAVDQYLAEQWRHRSK